MANKNRTKGHNAERYYRNEFVTLGYSYCQTARYGSRMHDDAGIDLINVPFNVQIKCGYKRGLNLSKVLRDMREAISELFAPDSPENDKMNIVIWRKDAKRGTPRQPEDDLVVMTWDDYKRIVKRLDQ